MATMSGKLRAEGTQPESGAGKAGQHEAQLLRSLRTALEGYLRGRRLIAVKVRQTDGDNVHGILKIEGVKGELLMLDFKATRSQGGFSCLEVGGRRIAQAAVAEGRRAR